jgi:osmoprotectant transport system ATP-binding protein
MISVAGVRKSYGSVVALAATSLDVASGERLALVGPSGCGKSTILRLIVGIAVPDGGAIVIGGTPLTPATAPSLRLRIGYVIQEGGLFPHLTAEENVTLLARRRGWSAERIASRVGDLAQLTRVAPPLLSRYPLQLSGGQRQRVGLMRALMLDPDVLLLDEPMGALDPMVRAQLQDDLLEVMNRLAKSVIFVTHDVYEAALFGHRIAVMREGRIVQVGTMRSLVETPADPFVGAFLRAQRGSGLGRVA